MAISVRSASWVNPADRTAPAVWLGIIWLGMIMGFGADFPSFLHKQPPASGILYAHAAVFVGWLILVTMQVVFVLRGRLRQHQRLGSVAGYIALLMVPFGLAAGLTAAAQGRTPPALLALNLVDLLGFIAFIAIGLRYRRHSAAHKRLMMLAMISIADPGFARVTKHLLPHPNTPLDAFVSVFYGNIVAPEANTSRAARGRLIADRCRVLYGIPLLQSLLDCHGAQSRPPLGHAVGIS